MLVRYGIPHNLLETVRLNGSGLLRYHNHFDGIQRKY